MVSGTRRRSEHLALHFIAWIFLGVMLFSLGYHERSEKSWGDDVTYRVEAQHFAFGAPRPWLVYNAVNASGAPPPIELLPGGVSFVPGVHVDVARAIVAASLGFAAALFVFALCWAAWPRMARNGETPRASGLLVIAFFGVLVGAVTPTDPVWIGAALGLGLLPAVIAAVCWRREGFVSIAIGSAVGVLSMVWVQSLSPLVWRRLTARDFDLHEYMVAPAATFAVVALVVLAVVTVKRLVER